MMLSRHSYCRSLPGSYDECRTPPTLRPDWWTGVPHDLWVHSLPPFIVFTRPESRYLFYCST